MSKTFNFYCDESCHLEGDDKKYMILSYVSCAYNQTRLHNRYIRDLKIKHHFKGEVKWSALSKSMYPFYSELIDYFFATDLQFRAIIIDKVDIDNNSRNQTQDEFYNKMYYQLLNSRLDDAFRYNIYLDVKDTRSYEKAKKLKMYLNSKDRRECVRNLQTIRSYESELIQLDDVLMGAIAYYLNCDTRNVIAKQQIIDKIERHHGSSLKKKSSPYEDKFNLFYIDLK